MTNVENTPRPAEGCGCTDCTCNPCLHQGQGDLRTVLRLQVEIGNGPQGKAIVYVTDPSEG